MHNGRLGVIGFKVFECGGWVEDRVLVTDSAMKFAEHPVDALGFKIYVGSLIQYFFSGADFLIVNFIEVFRLFKSLTQ